MLAEYGQLRSGLEQLVEVGFRTLGLHTFLTAGPKEARAWTIHIGDTAPKPPASSTPTSNGGSSRRRSSSYDDLIEGSRLGPVRPLGGASSHRGQGLCDAGRRRGGVPLQRLRRMPFGRSAQRHGQRDTRRRDLKPRALLRCRSRRWWLMNSGEANARTGTDPEVGVVCPGLTKQSSCARGVRTVGAQRRRSGRCGGLTVHRCQAGPRW